MARGDELLVAYVATFNEKTVSSVSAVTNPGAPDQGTVTLTRAAFAQDTYPGNGGYVSVWTARLPVNVVTATVTATITGAPTWSSTMWVQPYSGAGGVGVSKGLFGPPGPGATAASVTLTPQRTGSLVTGVGYDSDNITTRVAGSGQTIAEQYDDPTNFAKMWWQKRNATTTRGTAVTLNDTAPTNEQWDLVATEITPR
jgi:hypothetical protein